MADEELERFKRLKLHEYAASLGYALDQQDSSRREVVMRRAADKISIRCDTDGHYVFYSFRDPADHGTILDFVMGRQGKNFGEARKTLRQWTGRERVPIHQPLDPAPRFDRAAVRAEYAVMRHLLWHDYLEQERALPRSALLSERFRGCIRVDRRSNVIFPHFDEEGVCGFEKRNRNFKGFADLGQKTLWRSNRFESDRQLVIGEGAINCISYAVLFPARHARYVSFGGGMSEEQIFLVSKACREMPADAEIVCITDADADGDRYAEILSEASGSLAFHIHRPEGVKDWNDALRARETGNLGLHSFPAGR